MHPENHFHLCEKGLLRCYLGFVENKPAAVSATMHNGENFSLEFVATLIEYRRKGLAKTVCARAIEEAFHHGAKIITLRSLPESKKLYLALGFKFF